MGRKKLTPAQQQLVDRVTRTNQLLRREKTEAFARARLEAERAVAAIQSQQDAQVREAVDAGVPLAEFRRSDSGLHTSDPGTVLRALERTEQQAETLAEVEPSGEWTPYSYQDGVLTITPPAQEVDAIADHAETDADYGYTIRAVGIMPNGRMLDLETPATLEDSEGFKEPNPPVTWLQQGDHEAEAIAWWKENVA